MRKTTYLFIILAFLSCFTKVEAQNLDVESDYYLIWKKYNSWLSPNQSQKTTNTFKRIKASSLYFNGAFKDSFLVLQPSNFGSSRIDFNTLYLNYSLHPTPFGEYDIPEASQIDFKHALHYKDSLINPDTINRVYDANDRVVSDRLKFVTSGSGVYSTSIASYTYDSQGRVVSYVDVFSIPGGATITSNISINYNLSTNYFISDQITTTPSSTLKIYDSVIINSNLVSELYRSINNGPYNKTSYTYDANGILTTIETYFNSVLDTKSEYAFRPNSDYPDSFKVTRYNINDTTLKMVYFDFNASTSYPEMYREVRTDQGFTTVDTCDITTDSDGDITDLVYRDVFGTKFQETHFYYEEFPDGNSEFAFDADIQAYPVPSSNEVKITSSELFDGYVLYDISGRIIQARTFTKTQERDIDLSSFSPGIYFLEVMSGGQKQRLKIERN